MKKEQTNRQVLNLMALQNIYRASRSAREASGALPWIPLIMACVLETVWVVVPWGSGLGFFSLLACILMAGVSLIVGIVMLIQGKSPLRGAWILFCTVFLLPLLILLFFEVLHLDLLLH